MNAGLFQERAEAGFAKPFKTQLSSASASRVPAVEWGTKRLGVIPSSSAVSSSFPAKPASVLVTFQAVPSIDTKCRAWKGAFGADPGQRHTRDGTTRPKAQGPGRAQTWAMVQRTMACAGRESALLFGTGVGKDLLDEVSRVAGYEQAHPGRSSRSSAR